MPTSNTQRESAATVGEESSFKRNPTVVLLLLKAIIMAIITCLFFVFLGVAAILLLNLCLACGLLHRRSNLSHNNHSFQDSYQQQQNQPQSTRHGLSPSDLRKVPEFRSLNGGRIMEAIGKGREANSVDCAICLDEVKEGHWCRMLIVCGHVFHRGCVDPWLVKVAACPLCRRWVMGPSEEGGSGRDLKVDDSQGLLRL